jgi:Flp pilus assembly protein TadD
MGLGASLERLGRRADAVAEYREFVKRQPASREADRVKVYLATLR